MTGWLCFVFSSTCLGCACMRKNRTICAAVIPPLYACLTLSLVTKKTDKFGNLKKMYYKVNIALPYFNFNFKYYENICTIFNKLNHQALKLSEFYYIFSW